MKKLITIFIGIVLSLFSLTAQQIIRLENAKYFDENKNLFNGLYIERFENGKPRIEMNLKNGEQDSITTIYFESGAINEIRSYQKGLMHGRWEVYNEAGLKLSEAWYAEEKKTGCWRIWNSDGKLIYEMHYSRGEKCGTWKIFEPDGSVKAQRDYDACE